MKYGIVIIALGYPLYGNAAYNLALSLKASTPDVPIALVYEPHTISRLSDRELAFFDHFIQMPEDWYTINGKKQYQRSKLCVNLVTNHKDINWDYTIYMDADNIWLDKPVSWLFGELHSKKFYIGMNGEYNAVTKQVTGKGYTYWGEPKDICKYHNIRKLPQTVSGFLYFKNGPEADEIFEKARAVYDDPKAPTILWANGKPDEYCMNVALGEMNYSQGPAHIFYFDKINGSIDEYKIKERFWGIATGGNVVSSKLIHIYNRLVEKYCYLAGIKTRHFHVDKKDVITERLKF